MSAECLLVARVSDPLEKKNTSLWFGGASICSPILIKAKTPPFKIRFSIWLRNEERLKTPRQGCIWPQREHLVPKANREGRKCWRRGGEVVS